jgi:methylmalonyl-CoA mutase N-terminal domain/subunit
MAAVLGGAQSLHTNSRDEALSLPTEEAVEIALRTQQIIASESNVTKTIDPVGGAHAIEALTDKIEEQARAYIQQIDDLGGAVQAIELGFPQKEIQQSAYRHQKEVEDRSRMDDEPEPALMRVDPALAQQQMDRVAALRAQRETAPVQAALAQLEQAARGTDNLMPYIIDAVECYATLGEIADTFRSVFGEHQEQVMLAS